MVGEAPRRSPPPWPGPPTRPIHAPGARESRSCGIVGGGGRTGSSSGSPPRPHPRSRRRSRRWSAGEITATESSPPAVTPPRPRSQGVAAVQRTGSARRLRSRSGSRRCSTAGDHDGQEPSPAPVARPLIRSRRVAAVPRSGRGGSRSITRISPAAPAAPEPDEATAMLGGCRDGQGRPPPPAPARWRRGGGRGWAP